MGRNCSAPKRRNSNIAQMALKGSEVIDLDDYSSSPEPKRTPIRTIFCLRNRDEVEKYEEEEDCFILEFDPYKKVFSSKDGGTDEVDLEVVAEKGQVACRDFPHPRHTCVNLPFEKTSHDRHCEMCCCYVCDLPAPCSKWTGSSGHCHAFNNEAWNERRTKHRVKKPTIVALGRTWST